MDLIASLSVVGNTDDLGTTSVSVTRNSSGSCDKSITSCGLGAAETSGATGSWASIFVTGTAGTTDTFR